MFTKIAIALAVVLATATGSLAATKKQNTNDGRGGFDQRSSYSSDWSYWHRYDDMGDYN